MRKTTGRQSYEANRPAHSSPTLEIDAKPRLYLETSVLSYLTARASRDLVTAGHQSITIEWWDRQRHNYDLCISDLVRTESERGDPDAARRRLALIESMEVLEGSDEVLRLAAEYIRRIPLPITAEADATHIAFAAYYEVDYLLTWNCRHIANGVILRRLAEVNLVLGILSPTVCTPEELYYGIEGLEG